MKKTSPAMKQTSFVVLIASFALLAAAAELPPWRNPAVNSINRLPARAIAVPCESADVALAVAKGEKPRTASRWITSLNGTWDFKWKHTVDAPGWEKTGEIAVPGCWQLQGDYDPAVYTNARYPIAGEQEGDPMREPPKEYTSHYFRNPVGLYSRTFSLPEGWKGRRTVIHFGGVSSAMYVRLNGQAVGYSEDSRLPAEFDLTPYLVDGANALEVEVLKHCDGSFLEDQDFWRLSGLFRDVWLVSEAVSSPYDLVVDAALSDDFKTGTLTVKDGDGQVVLEKKYENPKLWSCEAPNLYYETIKAGSDFYAVAFGFRKVEIKDAVLYINGKRALFMGVDRHEMEPATGYTVTLADMKRDIAIFHDLNVNAVRTSHYPNDPTWYALCDREGIYVVCEANIEAHGVQDYYKDGPHLPKNPLYRTAIVERNVNMVKVFRNHPSVVTWSLGNESGDGPAMVDAYAAVKALDATRPVQYECAQDKDHSDVKCPMYARPWEVEKYVKDNPKKPYILCEYTHAMGNSNGGIQKYWDLVRKYPSAQGGFIWDFADQALWKADARGTSLAYGGDFGDAPNDDNFNCNGIVAADRTYHPGCWEVRHVYQPVHVDAWDWETKTATIYNAYRFTCLGALSCTWCVQKGGAPVARGELDLSGIAPDAVAGVRIPDAPDGEAMTFVFRSRQTRKVVAHDQFAKPFVPVAAPEAEATGASAGAFKMAFWRAPTDNDRGWKMPEVCKVWKEATLRQKAPAGAEASLAVARAGKGCVVDLQLDVRDGKLPKIPRVGVSFQIPRDFVNVKWYGLGPWENYSDRATSAFLDVHAAAIGVSSGLADGAAGIAYVPGGLNPDNYIEPGEQGHRGGCRWVEFSNAAGQTIRITALNAPFGFNAWPYSQETLEKARHQFDLADAGEITVVVDAIQMGVGGDDSWGAKPHGAYLPSAGRYELKFLVEGL